MRAVPSQVHRAGKEHIRATDPSCQHCGSGDMRRLISKVSVHRSWGSSLDWVPDSGYPDNADQEDPRQMAEWMRRMRKEMGEEVTPEFEQMVDELESEAEEHDHGEEPED